MIESTSKINKKILNCGLFLSAIYDLTSRLVENTTQEDIDILSSMIEKYNTANILLHNSIKTFIMDIADIPSEEIDVELNDNGYKV